MHQFPRLFRFGYLQAAIYAVASLVGVAGAQGQPAPISTTKSTMTLRVFKAGVFSAFGHDHEIAAPLAGGTVDLSGHRVELRVNASALRVADPGVSEKDRAEIQKTMLGPEVLDIERYPEITFRSMAADSGAPGVWHVRGTLTLHGASRPVAVEVNDRAGHFVGSARLKQTDFDIKPVKVAGGTVRVKDEIRVDFDIQLEDKGGKLP
jgi:polyisoprenoid-binding protein YceI